MGQQSRSPRNVQAGDEKLNSGIRAALNWRLQLDLPQAFDTSMADILDVSALNFMMEWADGVLFEVKTMLYVFIGVTLIREPMVILYQLSVNIVASCIQSLWSLVVHKLLVISFLNNSSSWQMFVCLQVSKSWYRIVCSLANKPTRICYSFRQSYLWSFRWILYTNV